MTSLVHKNVKDIRFKHKSYTMKRMKLKERENKKKSKVYLFIMINFYCYSIQKS